MPSADAFLKMYAPPPDTQATGPSADSFLKMYAPAKADAFDTMSDQALQGATFGLGNRAAAGLAALVQTGINGKPLAENYKDARNVESDRLRQEMAARPATAIASNLAGALATGGLAADTAPGAAVADWLRSGNLAARVGKGALAGAVSGSAYGAGTADYGKSLEGAKKGAVSGAVVGGAVPIAGAALESAYQGSKNAIAGALARSPEQLQDAAAAMKGSAGDLYEQMRNIGATLTPDASRNLLTNMDNAIKQQKFIPALNPKTVAIVDDIKNAAANGSLGVSDLDQYRRLLGRIAPTEDGVSAGAVRKSLDSFLMNAAEGDFATGGKAAVDLLNKARPAYAQASKFGDITDILTKAAGDPNRIKAGLQRFLNNADNLKGWNQAEIDSLKEAAANTVPEKLFKMAGKFGIDLGTSLTPGNTVAPVVGAVASGSPVTPVAGTAARQMQKYLARGKAENLLDTIANGAAAAAGTPPVSPLLAVPSAAGAGILKGGNATPTMPPLPSTPTAPLPLQSDAAPPTPSRSPDLFSRVLKQESGGQQSAVSPKGAIGVAQIMPKTAPEAAKAAGLPFDPYKLRTDPEYNAALGKAYLGKMLDKYQGDEKLALMAYNWGPGNVDMWLKSGANPQRIPKETRNYLSSILGG